MRAIHVSAHAGYVTLQSGVQHQGHAVGGPHHHHRHTLRLDYEMFVVLGKSISKNYILITIDFP